MVEPWLARQVIRGDNCAVVPPFAPASSGLSHSLSVQGLENPSARRHGEGAVWVVGPSTYDTLPAVARAFERLGWKVCRRTYVLVQTRFQRWLWKLAPRLGRHTPFGWRPWLEARWYNRFLRAEVLPELVRSSPDLLVFVRPYRIESDVRVCLAKLGRPLVTWATDSLSRYGPYAGIWSTAACNYVFDGADARDGAGQWLPPGFNDELFQPADQQDWDVLFVGRIFYRLYGRRLRILERLTESELPATWRVAWAGSVVRQHKRLASRFQESGGVLLGDLPMDRLARTIARARIAVSIHQDDGQQPVNPLFFAIPGCRACLVTDRREYLQNWLKPQDEFVPVDEESCVARLAELLKDEPARARLAEAGYRAALRHTWVARVQTILHDLQLA